MKTNITLTGMPGAGKSTVGIILARILGYGFIDTDVLIQINNQQTLQEILDKEGYLDLRHIEEQEICKLNISRHVIATGGSAVYSDRAMKHLQSISTIVFLDVSCNTILSRITDFNTRGIAQAPGQSFESLYTERQELYRTYTELTVDCNRIGQDYIAETLARDFKAYSPID